MKFNILYYNPNFIYWEVNRDSLKETIKFYCFKLILIFTVKGNILIKQEN